MIKYIQFFTDFMRVTQDVKVKITFLEKDQETKVEFQTSSKEEKETVQKYFPKYLESALRKDFPPLDLLVEFDNPKATEIETDLLAIEYESLVSNLKKQLEYTERLLSKGEEKNHLKNLINK